MANKPSTSSGHARIRFTHVDFDGPADQLQQLVQTFAQAVKAPQQIFVTAPAPAALPAPSPFGGDSRVLEQPGEITAVVEDGHPPQAVNGSATEAGTKPRRRKYKTPSVIPDLEFTGGPMPLQRYIDVQAPEENSKRYLAIAFWLKEYRNYEEIGADHIYTCYRALGLNVPDDVLSVFRGLKKRGWVIEGSQQGLFKINHIGEGQLKKVSE